MKSKYIYFIFVLLTSFVRADELSTEAVSILKAILNTYELENQKVFVGMGRATVLDQRWSKERMEVDFWYKEQKRRADIYVVNNSSGERGLLKKSIIDNGQSYYVYRPKYNSADIEKSDAQVKHQIGRDFHPNMFQYCRSLPISKMLKFLLKEQHTFKVKISSTQSGLIMISATSTENIEYEEREVEKYSHATFEVDPKHAFRIHSFLYSQRNINGAGSLDFDKMIIQWNERHETSGWGYPQSIKIESRTVFSHKQFQNPPDDVPKGQWNRDNLVLIEIDINDIKMNIPIDDNLFTLEGMGICNGTRIDDNISGIVYSFGASTSPLFDDDLESFWSEVNKEKVYGLSVNEIADSDTKAVKTALNHEVDVVDNSHSSKTNNEAVNDEYDTFFIMLSILIICCILVVLVIYKKKIS